jgi:hypothetical protein
MVDNNNQVATVNFLISVMTNMLYHTCFDIVDNGSKLVKYGDT